MHHLRTFILFWGLLLLTASWLHAEGDFKYSYVPKKVYENQLFPVTIIDSREEKSKPHYQFDPSNSVRPLSMKPLIIRNGNDNFYTFYYKAHKRDITVPRITIDADGRTTILEQRTVPVQKLKQREDFCGVLAADMKVRNHQVSHYDEQNYLVTLSIEAFEANLEDMHLSGVAESGIEELEREGAKVKAEFYVVIPTTRKKLKFTYFNTIKQQYVFLEVPVELLDSTVVTQTELNPKEDSFDKLKKYIFLTLVGFFFLMFLVYRDFFYLILGVVSLITLLTFYTPKKHICVKQGAPLYILPTKTSSISTKIDKELHTPLLGERLEFRKIEYKNGIIGWIKNEDLCEN
ncbi:hypothetical protein ACM66Z_05215 [Sulfurovum sp. ST-21]|uniref:Periplasmic protein n=1 Tax=Sulfurovum indicum TaxID=2779528 RepID=A0A7M1S817_9BACT|nr:hypothetical protein [Sulfurovum indicum]QOR62859.1 hypothetical protein IMZ28_05180 [Sulfurovum indicum]